ncbi:uncharacterized protein LOC127845206 isoform X1 [Dreissena polymorpha]|uniref:Chitin-binding type-4 domain-containing protein n=2 Tax=Dreissena polymorpha TaxID=45954 RepID=A0A9D4IGR8_DREPO|nr:uncharacterized protein LOC127845206 isoform X1 [Dreissena polymorpha]KAH3771907.1 hypothetical protein DPMN_173236 [Dreissena polymorpha]
MDTQIIAANLALLLCGMAYGVWGHGRLLEPPARSSAWRYGFPVPNNKDDHGVRCPAGMTCSLCGNPDNEAGGMYARGILVQNYTQGQTILIKLEITVNHGGYSTFRICPNNDVNKPVTQECLNRYLLTTPSGESRYIHEPKESPTGTGYKYLHLVLPRDLTCTLCVIQWEWVTNSNNNCNFQHPDCCNRTNVGCGPQERFYGCADVSVLPALYHGAHPASTPLTSNTVTVDTGKIQFPEGFQLIGSDPGLPAAQVGQDCIATQSARSTYGATNADMICRHLCVNADTCPVSLCADTCRLK